LIGKNEHAIKRHIQSDSRIETTGAVAEAIPELARAAVAVVPLLSGSGTRIKIIEAWAAGVPVVSTTIGAEGLPYTSGDDILIADEPHDFAEAVRRILNDCDLARRLSASGRRLYELRLTWNTAWRQLEQAEL
jgi:glycosyltransferase involved in cell wall biosynthesis